jgi:hypothetical protein
MWRCRVDIAGLKPLFGQQCIAVAAERQFIGTMEPVPNSASTVSMTKVGDEIAAKYDFAINGVAALDVGSISFCQRLADYAV